MKQRVSVVITDLDDTLWDWVDLWYRPFKAMLDRLVQDSGVSREELLSDFKHVHTQHGTSEYAFSLQELPSLLRKHSAADIPTIYAGAIDAFRAARRDVMHLYPEVEEVLQKIRDKGALLIGYTESLAFYTRYRLIKFGLDRVFDYLYSPADHELPAGLSPEALRRYGADHYELRRTQHRHTPAGSHKPCPEVLLRILSDVGANPAETIYIGDKLVKDVSMAKAANITDVYAAYGDAHDRAEYELLRRVTHWTPQAVQKERDTSADDMKPSFTLRRSLAELHDVFEFVPYVDMSPERLKHATFAWSKAVDVQQHFNEIEMKIRNYVISLVAAVLAAVVLAAKEGRTGLSLAVMVIGAIGVFLFAMMDGLWYHRLLKGAVRHTAGIEKRLSRYLPELGLSQAIGRASPIGPIHSDHKLWIFYALLLFAIVGGAVAIPLWCGPSAMQQQPQQSVSPLSVGAPSTQPASTSSSFGSAASVTQPAAQSSPAAGVPASLAGEAAMQPLGSLPGRAPASVPSSQTGG